MLFVILALYAVIDAARHVNSLSAERQKSILAVAAKHGGSVREYYKRHLNPGDNGREKKFWN